MKTIKIGTVKGRHEMPVEEYLMDEVVNPMDFVTIHNEVFASMKTLLEPYIRTESSVPVNGNYDECQCFVAPDICVHLYVTGLTAVTIEAVKFLVLNGINCKIMHFNRDTGSYEPQNLI